MNNENHLTLGKIIFPFFEFWKINKDLNELQKLKIKDFKLFNLTRKYEHYKFWGDLIFKFYIIYELFYAFNKIQIYGHYRKIWILRAISFLYTYCWIFLYQFPLQGHDLNFK